MRTLCQLVFFLYSLNPFLPRSQLPMERSPRGRYEILKPERNSRRHRRSCRHLISPLCRDFFLRQLAASADSRHWHEIPGTSVRVSTLFPLSWCIKGHHTCQLQWAKITTTNKMACLRAPSLWLKDLMTCIGSSRRPTDLWRAWVWMSVCARWPVCVCVCVCTAHSI